ncbi:MAG: tRNA uridine-5-carboxymethylaminomethyl(34) synthesis GTPase MnmE [Eubacteriales bacterium]|nr:tRNA uridine-5-carboxymethylaminomethyl(34) synthesis GTPase MnmE [Eubacteriales bacterium]
MADTIAAVATAMSASGIGIVRISGEDCMDVIHRIYRSKGGTFDIRTADSHTIHYGYIYDGEEIVDEVLVMIMKAPRTFTGENTVEIDCHGGVYAMRRVLETVVKNGARIAEPGEFTKRAFLNGRLDLSQAEAVIDVIQSQNSYALKSSISQLKGSVKTTIEELRSRILYHIAYIESALDDPEHISLDGYSSQLRVDVEEELARVERLLATASDGKMIKEGIKTVILGKPNAGKSSLLNLLVGENKAIVTDIAGTTRDILEEYINLSGISLRIVDTAGIRATDDVVEKIGVGRAKDSAKDADLILYVVDSSTSLDENDVEIMQLLKGKKAIILLNKADLPSVVNVETIVHNFVDNVDNSKNDGIEYPIVAISAKEETGMEELEEQIKQMFFHGELTFNNEVYITNARHKAALEETKNSLNQVLGSIDLDMPEDFYSIDLMNAYKELGSIIGEEVGEDLVNEIFSKFCTGK